VLRATQVNILQPKVPEKKTAQKVTRKENGKRDRPSLPRAAKQNLINLEQGFFEAARKTPLNDSEGIRRFNKRLI
jgi:hypothetical protein